MCQHCVSIVSALCQHCVSIVLHILYHPSIRGISYISPSYILNQPPKVGLFIGGLEGLADLQGPHFFQVI